MGGSFLEFMKSIGIFILCAQSFMHFAAGKAYEKYVKLLIGVMILAQFMVPVRGLFLGRENAQMWEEIEQFRKELENMVQESGREAGAAMGSCGGEREEKKAVEEEIRARLSEVAARHGMKITKVSLLEEPPKAAVWVSGAEEGAQKKIEVEKITIGSGKGQDIEDWKEGTEKEMQDLAEAFSEALGVGEDYLEIFME